MTPTLALCPYCDRAVATDSIMPCLDIGASTIHAIADCPCGALGELREDGKWHWELIPEGKPS